MSEVQKITTFCDFVYPVASNYRKTDNTLMLRLNYMTSRIRAVLSHYMSLKINDDARLWWWTGVQKEVVTYQILVWDISD
jgi:hypothetical protein